MPQGNTNVMAEAKKSELINIPSGIVMLFDTKHVAKRGRNKGMYHHAASEIYILIVPQEA